MGKNSEGRLSEDIVSRHVFGTSRKGITSLAPPASTVPISMKPEEANQAEGTTTELPQIGMLFRFALILRIRLSAVPLNIPSIEGHYAALL